MPQKLTINRSFHIRRGWRSHKALRDGEAPPQPPHGRVPRVSRLMALAIRFEGLIHDGVVADQAELARLGHVTRARLTQIMNLLNLAPDLQEEILSLPRVENGHDPLRERQLRPIAAVLNWREQRRMWKRLNQRPPPGDLGGRVA